MKSHDGRIAIVTGAASGIGQELARQLAVRGAKLALLDLADLAKTLDLVAKAGGEALAIRCDVTSEADWQAARQQVEDRYGRADILVNNAGIYPFATLDDLTPEMFRKVVQVNLEGPFLGVRTFAPLMAKNGWGRIVNIASNSVMTNLAGLSHYMASKMGVVGLTRGLANDLAAKGVTVNAVAPALTQTPGTSIMPDEMTAAVWHQQAIQRFAVPADIVGPILFLTSDDAAFVTGQTIVADGGFMKL